MDKSLKPINVFISSPGDVQEERQIAIDILRQLNSMSHIQNRYVLKPLAYEKNVPAAVGKSPQSTVDRYMMEAGKSDIFICILWQRMGTPVTDDETGEKFNSGTEYEFMNAYRANEREGKPCMLLYRSMKPITPEVDPRQLALVQAFFKRFEGVSPELKGLYIKYHTTDEIKELLCKDVDKLIAENFQIKGAEVAGTALPTETRRRDFYQHIPLPVNYVLREELLKEVCNSLLTDAFHAAPASEEKRSPVALHGMGGIGKSVIARALCDNQQLQAAFPDGILWTTLGQEPDLLSKLREWIHALGGTVSETAPSVDSLRNGLVRLLEKRACLLMVDDVWKRKHAEVFLVAGPQCRLLITTRDTEIAHEIGARVQPVPAMTLAEALQLLEEWAAEAITHTDSGTKEKIVNMLGRLPLAVKLAGAQLKRQRPDEWLKTFDVLKLRSNRPEDVHDSLKLTFELSLNVLENNKRHLYAALSIFIEDEATPEVAITRLWETLNNLSKEETAELINDLESRASLEVAQKTESRTIRLHDLPRDLMRVELGERRSNEAHLAILESYQKTRAGHGWHTAKDDGYLYDRLVYHLHAVSEIDEIKNLFADHEWLDVRVPQHKYEYDGYLSDLMIAWEAANQEAKDQIEKGLAPEAFIDCMRYALIRSSINSIAGNYAPELIARALELKVWNPHRALSIAAKVPNTQSKVKLYAVILSTGTLEKSQQDVAQRLGLDAALAIKGEGFRAGALATLAPQLTGEQLQKGMDAALAIEDEMSRAWALAALAPQLTGEQLQKGLDAALAIKDEGFRAGALATLAPQLTGEQKQTALQKGLDAALAIKDERFRAKALAALAPQLTGEQLQKGLDAVLAIKDEGFRAGALATLAPQLTGEQKQTALQKGLDAALAIEDKRSRAKALAALAPQLTGEQLQKGLDATLAIEDERSRAGALAALAPQLTGEQLQKGLDAALAIEDERSRAWALAALAPQLTGEQKQTALQKGLDAALAIKDEWSRAWALAALAPQLTGEQKQTALQNGLDAALAIKDERFRAWALAALAPRLTGEQLQNGLDAALAIEDERSRAWALAALAPQLTGEQLQRCRDAARAIKNKGERLRVLLVFLPLMTHDAGFLKMVYRQIVDYLFTLQNERREDILEFCTTQNLFAHSTLFDQKTLNAIANLIIEICWDWHWL